MRFRVLRGAACVMAVIIVLLVGLTGPGGAAAAPAPQQGARALGQDNDGDYLDDFTDPDDDNDGVPDMYDEDPFDPSIGVLPTPGPLDPHHDSDDDGIPNIQDPDDDLDGIADEDDPTPLDPEPVVETPVPTDPDPGPARENSGNSPTALAEPIADTRPMVVSLPVTGDGHVDQALSVLIGVSVLTAIASILLLVAWRAGRHES